MSIFDQVKNFHNSLFVGGADEDYGDYGSDIDVDVDPVDDGDNIYGGYGIDDVDPTPNTFVQEPVMPQRAETQPVAQHNATVVMLTPYDIRTSQIVCDHIKAGHIVLCNLTNTEKNQRVVDYISGAVYALGGRVEPTPVKTTFVCTPKTVDLIKETEEAVVTKVAAM